MGKRARVTDRKGLSVRVDAPTGPWRVATRARRRRRRRVRRARRRMTRNGAFALYVIPCHLSFLSFLSPVIPVTCHSCHSCHPCHTCRRASKTHDGAAEDHTRANDTKISCDGCFENVYARNARRRSRTRVGRNGGMVVTITGFIIIMCRARRCAAAAGVDSSRRRATAAYDE